VSAWKSWGREIERVEGGGEEGRTEGYQATEREIPKLDIIQATGGQENRY
jgi:hypothetical protein